MDDAQQVKLEPVVLGNIAGGKLEEQFATCMAELAEVLEQADDFEVDSEGYVHAKIEMAVEVTYKEGSLGVAAGANLKRPKRKKAGRALFHRGREFFVYDEGEQLPLLPKRSVSALRPEKGA